MSLPKTAPSSPWRRPARTLGALSASVIVLPIAAGAAHAATVPVPTPTRTLPSALDVAPPYQPGTLCLAESQPGPIAFAKLLNRTYGEHSYGVLRRCDQEHGEGRALDWMLDARKSADLAIGNAVTRWLAAPDDKGRAGAMARRFGVNYIIWNRQIWKAWAPERGWAAYTGSSPHTDHIHLSFTWDGAYATTSWWTGVPVVDYRTGPKGGTGPTSEDLSDYVGTVLRLGSRGQAVAVLQQALGGIAADGSFGPATETRVKQYQRSIGSQQTGVVGSTVWKALIAGAGSTGSGSGAGSGTGTGTAGSGSTSTPPAPTSASLAEYVGTTLRLGSRGEAVRALQSALGGLTVDGSFGPATETQVKRFQRSIGSQQTGVVGRTVWNALSGRNVTKTPSTSESSSSSSSSSSTSPLAKYAGVTLRLWSRGEAVKAMQRAVGGLTADGSFGPKTLTRVKAWQKSKGLAVDGVIDAKDWKVLMGASATSTKTGSASSSSSTSTSATASRGVTTAGTSTGLTAYKSTTLRRGSSGSAVRALQRAVGGLAVDGRFGPNTESRVKAVQRSAGRSASGVVDRATWDVVERRAHPLLPYWGTVLKRGSHGSAVKALQKALRITADGSFGPQTEAAVKAAQGSARIARTGVVATVTWKAIEARMR